MIFGKRRRYRLKTGRTQLNGLRLFFYLFLIGAKVFGQGLIVKEGNSPLPLKFAHFSSKDGLPQNSVLAIYQDKTGFIWMGTDDGLARFDGYQFQVYRQIPNQPGALHNNVIRAIIADPLGYLWIGTEGGGISIMDPQRERFVKFSDLSPSLYELASAKITSLIKDENQNIWVGTNGNGVFKISLDFSHSKEINSYQNSIKLQHFGSKNSNLGDDKIWKLFQDRQRNIWIGTLEGGVYQIPNGKGSPKKVNLNIQGDLIQSVKSFFEDEKGNFWVGTEKYGLFYRKAGELDFRQLPLPETRKVFQQEGLNITSFEEDHLGHLWIGTLGRGLYILNQDSSEIFHFEDDPSDPYSLNGNSVYTLFKDKSRNFWLGMYSGEGLNKVSPTQQQFEHYRYDPDLQKGLSGKMVKSILKDDVDNLWVGLFNGGLNLLPARSSRFSYFTAGNNGMLSHNHVQSIFQRSNGELWIGTDGGGITIYSPKTGLVSYLKNNSKDKNSLSKNEVWSIVEDRKGGIWIGTANGGGLNHYNPEKGTFRHFVSKSEDPNSILFNDVRSLLIDSKNNLWVGTYGGGLSKIDLDTEEFQHYVHQTNVKTGISHNIITSIFEDKKGFIWVGTFGGGLNRINPLNDNVSVFREKDGLPSDIVKAILEDNQGQLWISTVKGLSALNLQNFTFRNYKEEDGLQSEEFNLGAAFKDKEGKLYFGGINGLNAFFPDRIQPYPSPRTPVLTSLKVLSKKVGPSQSNGEGNFLEKSITYLDNIVLQSDQNSFEFEFSALEYMSQEKIKYDYQLTGYDQDWIETDSQRRFANYANLSNGTYLFRVRAHYEGEENYSPIKELTITVLPPWYKSDFAYCLYFILFLVIGYTVKSFVSWRIRLRNDLRYERLEKEKQEEVNQLKMRFFTNISHELRTPLMLIKSPLEQLVQRFDLPKDAKRQLDSIHANAARLLRLINQLLDFRKQETGHLKLSVKRVEVEKFLHEIKNSFDVIAEQKGISFSLRIQDDVPSFLWFDPDQMEKVFFNLIYNAFKFTPEFGEIVLEVESGEFNNGDLSNTIKGVYFHVRDNGRGIPEDQIEYIFDRFFQVKEKGRTESTGTGIGLALSKNLVDFHKGKISVKSIPNEITVFTLFLREGYEHFEKHELVHEDDLSLEQEWVKTEVARLSLASSQSITSFLKSEKKEIGSDKILVVEDNPELLELLVTTLNKHFNVYPATHGKEALDFIQSHDIDFIISDVMMPEMDGVELCARIKGNLQTSHIPFILLTAKSSFEHQLEGYEAGADDYIPKPFNLELLVLKVKNLLDTRSKIHQQFKITPELTPEILLNSPPDEKFIKDAISIVQINLENEGFVIQDLVRELGVSRTLLFEKFKSLLGQTPNEFIQTIRLKYAAELIKSNHYKISEVAYKVGYSDPKYFSKSFQKQFGVTPTEFKKRKKEVFQQKSKS
ncbi:hybrid sensor histidine kinase/response regulator transcription factor [Algoriphagus mannitolivorans]|uniref:hybrid sensor histidine kinase/response regulator transcription factor n=1 Tax=Algoriphagus mannitolivorans TaxID=226504 RepID=UPI00040838C9|nr:two-component regulator propeller domain-containing protein [Algoriphagus mannitolivorans]